MKKIILAILVFVPTLFLSGCYVSAAPSTYYAGYNYAGYTPGWHSSYYGWGGGYYRGGWYGNRGWSGHGYRGGWGGRGWHGGHGGHGGWHRR